MARGEIQAGSAFVRVYAKTSELANALVSAEDRLRQFADVATIVGNALETVQRKANELTEAISNFGRRMALTGVAVSAAGISIATTLGAAITQFANFGESIAKMADRTGIGVQALSELGYAAEVAGTSISELELGIRQMQSKIAEKGLGLRGLPPERQLEILADRFTQLATAEERTAFAQEMFGRSGTRMLPLLAGGAAGIRQLREEAVRFGRAISEQDARNAERLKDAWQALVRAIRGVSVAIGSVFADSLTRILTSATEIVATFGRWIRENEALAKTVAIVAAGLVAIGAAITAAGIGLSVFVKAAGVLFGLAKIVGVVMLVAKVLLTFAPAIAAFVSMVSSAIAAAGVLSGIVTAIGTVASTLLPPLAIAAAILAGIASLIAVVAVGAVAAAVAFWKLADPFKALAPLAKSVIGSIRGIVGSLLSGDFEGAANAAIDGFREAMLQATKAIFEMVKTTLERLPTFISRAMAGAGGFLDSALRIISRTFTALWPAAMLSMRLFFNLAKDVFLQLPRLAAYSAGLIVRQFAIAFAKLFIWMIKELGNTIVNMGTSLKGLGEMLIRAMTSGDITGIHTAMRDMLASAIIGGSRSLGGLLSGLMGGAAPEFKLSEGTIAAYKALMAELKRAGALVEPGRPGAKLPPFGAAGGLSTVTYSASALAASGRGGLIDKMLEEAKRHREVAEAGLHELREHRRIAGMIASGLRHA